ncbi:MAG: response regulator transcription factor [Gammaproteobacteria bacterium]|nr:response regulator transcription factor [Gammaproteobacteria bacterium]
MRVLVVEDDPVLGQGLQSVLKQDGYAVDWVKDGESAILFMDSSEYTLVILDLGLPKLNGLEVLRHFRTAGKETPVLILTARDAVADKIAGLDAGADDYMTKPFDVDELAARARALSRRQTGRSTPVITHGDLQLDPAAHTVTQGGVVIEFSGREFSLLQALLENRGKVMSKDKLTESLYSWKDEIESNAIEVHIHHLRKKLGNNLIRTIRGVGYVIDKPE